jgi:hypothetical protein
MVVTVGIGRDRRSTPSLERTSLLISLLMIHAPMGGCLIRCLNSADRLHAAHLWGALRRQRSHGLWSCPISQTGRSATSSSPPPGIGKFRLIRLFGEPTGLTPHALQVAHRIRKARRLLEAGETIADIAAATGFVDGG